MNYFKDFNLNKNIIWLNCAHQGPLPKVALRKAHEAIRMKESPNRISDEDFFAVPQKLKNALASLINADPQNIVLGNSATFTVHLLANGIKFSSGDEILLVKGDFPTNYYSWLELQKTEVKIKFIECNNNFLSPDDLLSNITTKTKLLCVSHVNSFNGFSIDIKNIGKICSDNNILFVLNGSQSLGWRSLNLKSLNIDVLFSCGFKGLLGPYGTGFCWIRPELRESLEYNQTYWLAMQNPDNLENLNSDIKVQNNIGARKYDVFGTANFLNFMPWTASIEYLLKQNISVVEEYNQHLVSYFIENLDSKKIKLLSSKHEKNRSLLIYISHKKPQRNKEIFDILRQNNVYISLRKNNLRISPHLYNTKNELDKLFNILNEFSRR